MVPAQPAWPAKTGPKSPSNRAFGRHGARRWSPSACMSDDPSTCVHHAVAANHAAPHILFGDRTAEVLASSPRQFRFVVAKLLRDTGRFCSKIFQSRLRIFPSFHLDALARAVAISQPDAANCSPRLRGTGAHPSNCNEGRIVTRMQRQQNESAGADHIEPSSRQSHCVPGF